MNKIRAAFDRIISRLSIAPYEIPFALLTVLYGLSALVRTEARPGSVEAILPGWIVTMWTLTLFFGGVATLFGSFMKHTRTELTGQVITAYGLFVYTVALFTVGTSSSWFAAVSFLGFTIGALVRCRVLHLGIQAQRLAVKLDNDSQKE